MTKHTLALRKRPEAFAEACRRILPQLHGRRRERVRELAAYVGGHADLLRGTSLGTMEATNAYAWAKRMKSFGCSWSRAGAESMATVLSRTAAHRDLVPPPKDAFLTAPELSKVEAAAAARGREAAAQESAGAGWLPPSAGFPLAGFEASFLPTSWKRRFVR